ncbi:hypothetical protein ACHAPI_011487 [Fusarium lateritium]
MPIHKSCYGLLFVLASRRTLRLNVLHRVIYDTLKNYFSRINLKCGIPEDVQLDYGLPSRSSERRDDNIVIEFALTDPVGIKKHDVEPIITDFIWDAKRRPERPEHEIQPIIDEKGRILDFAKYWKNKFYDEMAWIQGLIPEEHELHRMHFDWKDFYNSVKALGEFGYGRGARQTRHRLQNRFRIARICIRIVDEGCSQAVSLEPTEAETTNRDKKVKPKNIVRGPLPQPDVQYSIDTAFSSMSMAEDTVSGQVGANNEVLKDAIPSLMPQLRPAPERFAIPVSGALSLMPDFASVAEIKPELTVFWTVSGELAGIAVGYTPAQMDAMIGATELAYSSESVVIPEHDWLSGITFTTQETASSAPGPSSQKVTGVEFSFHKETKKTVMGALKGDKRILLPHHNCFIVGLSAAWTLGGPLERVALLQQPRGRAPEASSHRINPADGRDRADLQVTNHLWAYTVPPSDLQLSRCHPIQTDPVAPLKMVSLLFDLIRPENFYISSLGIDSQFGALQISFAYNEKKKNRWIGPRGNAIEYFHITKGEVITQCYVTGMKKVEGLRFVTRKGRQIIVGKTGLDEKALVETGKGKVIAGFFGHWSDDKSHKAKLTSFGVFTRDDMCPDLYITPTEIDRHGFPWCPSGPAQKPSLKEHGPIYGQTDVIQRHVYMNKPVPSSQARVTWLDCSKALQNVQVTMCHNTPSRLLPMVSMTFFYADKTKQSTFGPRFIMKPDDTGGVDGHPWCHCEYGNAQFEERRAKPHYTSEIWQVGNSHLSTLRLWIDKAGVLTGLQFVAENNKESPKWGFCNSDTPVEIELEWPKRTGPALKVFLDSNGRNCEGEDFVLAAIQVMSVSTMRRILKEREARENM